MTLAEARLVLDNKEGELQDVFNKRYECKTNEYMKKDGTKTLMHESHEFTVDKLTETIERLQKEIRKLRLITTQTNIETSVDFTVDDEQITLQEAIYLIKQYRSEHCVLKQAGELRTESHFVNPAQSRWPAQNTVDHSFEKIIEPTFDTKKYRRMAEKLEILITKLEVAINQANYKTEVEVDGVEIKGIDDIDDV